MKRFRLLTAAAAATCGMFLAQVRADDKAPAAMPAPVAAAPMAIGGGACCQGDWDPCAKRGLLGNLFKKKSCGCETACNTCAAPVVHAAPACNSCNTGCDPCAQRKPGLLSFLHKKSCDSCDTCNTCAKPVTTCCAAPAPKCNTCDTCDPCAKKSFFKGLFAKKCHDDCGCAAPSCGGCATGGCGGGIAVAAPAPAAAPNPVVIEKK